MSDGLLALDGVTDIPTVPPLAPRREHRWVRPTGTVEDPWAWLRDKEDPETIAYLEAENTWSDRWFAARTGTVEELYEEIRSRIDEDDVSWPVHHRGWWYTSRTETGKNYAIHTRGRTVDTAGEDLLLDENIEAGSHDYFSLGALDVSNDGRLLAWSADTDGSEHFTLRVRDLSTGTDLPDLIPDTSWGGTAWSADDRHLFYVTSDEAMRPWRVWRHEMGASPSADVLVFEEPDERFFVGVGATRSGSLIVVESGSRTSSECWLIDASDVLAPARCVAPRRDDVEYQVDDWGDDLAIVSNLDAMDFAVHLASRDEPSVWRPFVTHEEGSRIVQFDCFSGFAVMVRWQDAQQCVSVVRRDGSTSAVPVLDEPHDVGLGSNPDWETDDIRLSYQSLTVPRTTASWSLTGGELVTLKRTPTPNCDLGAYVSRREWALAPNGTRVPLDIVHRVDTPLDGTAPVLLYGYGSYEASMPPWFSVARLSLLDRGWVWALAHPRGGGEMGRRWYLDGKLLAKRNTFTDVLACADHIESALIGDGRRLVVRGGSAGGLLVGACITMAPHRFAGAVAEVPFVHVVSTMSDPSLPLTVTEWEEWGDPRAEPFASYIEAYSPYDNTGDDRYPMLYVTAGLNDPRVNFHEPAKWVARLRHVSPGTFVLLRCEMGAGHGGPSGRYEQWRDEARTLTFVLAAADSVS